VPEKNHAIKQSLTVHEKPGRTFQRKLESLTKWLISIK